MRLNTDGTLDNTFLPPRVDAPTWSPYPKILVQDDGRILFGGGFTLASTISDLVRLNSDGSIDMTFIPDTNAVSTVSALALQSDRAILVESQTGPRDFQLVRLDHNGAVDRTFNSSVDKGAPTGSSIQTRVHSIAAAPEGKMFIGGQFTTVSGARRSGVARLNGDGSLDMSFNPATTNSAGFAIVLQDDGKVLLGGYVETTNGLTNSVVRLNSDGTVDSSFNASARVPGLVAQVSLAPDRKIFVSGYLRGKPAELPFLRLNTDGTLDSSFNPPSGTTGVFFVQPDGKPLADGYLQDARGNYLPSPFRLNPDGSLDTSFSSSFYARITAMARQPDGKFVVAGTVTDRGQTARLNSDGSLDNSFQSQSVGLISSIVLQPDGKILIGGSSTFGYADIGILTLTANYVVRLNSDGTYDRNFKAAAGSPSLRQDSVSSMTLQSNGKLLIAGSFTTVDGLSRWYAARLLTADASELSIAFSAGILTLSWPTNAAGLSLESISNLSSPLWITEATQPRVEQDRYAVSISASDAARFYRLKR